MADQWRAPNEIESKIFDKMLQADFSGVETLRLQLAGLQVREIDNEHSLELKVENQVRRLFKFRVPVEASYTDTDAGTDGGTWSGCRVHILLHVAGGLMCELEIYKDDGSSIHSMPEVSSLQVFTPENWDNQ